MFFFSLVKQLKKMTLVQFLKKIFRIMALLAFSWFFRYVFSFFSFPILLPPKELIDEINLFLCGKIGVVFKADVFTDYFKSLSNVFRGTSGRLDNLPSLSVSSPDSSPQLATEDCVPSSEPKKGFPYKKLLIGGLCVVGLASTLLYFFYSGGGGDFSALETLVQNNNSEQMRLIAEHSVELKEISIKLDFLIGQLTGISMCQSVLEENVRAVMEFLNPNGTAF